MNIRNIVGGLAGLIIVAILFFVRMGAGNAKIEQFGQETKDEFVQVLSQAEVCQKDDQKNYVLWLADACHAQCWADNHELESAGGRRTDVVVDMDGYSRDMLTAMMDMARRENAPHIAEGLGQFHAALFPIE